MAQGVGCCLGPCRGLCPTAERKQNWRDQLGVAKDEAECLTALPSVPSADERSCR